MYEFFYLFMHDAETFEMSVLISILLIVGIIAMITALRSLKEDD